MNYQRPCQGGHSCPCTGDQSAWSKRIAKARIEGATWCGTSVVLFYLFESSSVFLKKKPMYQQAEHGYKTQQACRMVVKAHPWDLCCLQGVVSLESKFLDSLHSWIIWGTEEELIPHSMRGGSLLTQLEQAITHCCHCYQWPRYRYRPSQHSRNELRRLGPSSPLLLLCFSSSSSMKNSLLGKSPILSLLKL